MRTEFGVARSSCSCDACQLNCKNMPGFLIPADLIRLVAAAPDPVSHIESSLLASPGALVMNTATGRQFRIHTLVPAVKEDGSCIHLSSDNRCAIHEDAPFGCAFFDCGPEPEGLAHQGLISVMETDDGLYSGVWQHLWDKGLRQKAPEILRAKMQQKLKGPK